MDLKNIGVILDLKKPNNFSLDHAQELAKTYNANIHLICMVPETLNVKQRQEIKDSIKKKVNFEFSLFYLTGKPLVEIIQYSDKKKLDMLLIEPDTREGISRFFYGSLALSLMRQTPCPLWVVKKPVSETYQRILIAVDPEEENTGAQLNDKLIQIGASYARQQSAECYLVTAWRLPLENMLSGPFMQTPPEKLEKLRDERKAECARAFEKLQSHHTELLKGCQTRMLNGDPGYAIPEFVKEQKIDLVIMGTLGRSGIKGFLIGNTAETIINQIECSIITIKPDGFTPPILL